MPAPHSVRVGYPITAKAVAETFCFTHIQHDISSPNVSAGNGEFDQVNYVGNYLRARPSTRKLQRLFHDGVDVVMPGSLFVADNTLEGNAQVNRDNWLGVGYNRGTMSAPEPFAAPPVTTEPAQDERIVREVRQGTGRIIKWAKDAGGWPDFPSATGSQQSK